MSCGPMTASSLEASISASSAGSIDCLRYRIFLRQPRSPRQERSASNSRCSSSITCSARLTCGGQIHLSDRGDLSDRGSAPPRWRLPRSPEHPASLIARRPSTLALNVVWIGSDVLPAQGEVSKVDFLFLTIRPRRDSSPRRLARHFSNPILIAAGHDLRTWPPHSRIPVVHPSHSSLMLIRFDH